MKRRSRIARLAVTLVLVMSLPGLLRLRRLVRNFTKKRPERVQVRQGQDGQVSPASCIEGNAACHLYDARSGLGRAGGAHGAACVCFVLLTHEELEGEWPVRVSVCRPRTESNVSTAPTVWRRMTMTRSDRHSSRQLDLECLSKETVCAETLNRGALLSHASAFPATQRM